MTIRFLVCAESKLQVLSVVCTVIFGIITGGKMYDCNAMTLSSLDFGDLMCSPLLLALFSSKM